MAVEHVFIRPMPEVEHVYMFLLGLYVFIRPIPAVEHV